MTTSLFFQISGFKWLYVSSLVAPGLLVLDCCSPLFLLFIYLFIYLLFIYLFIYFLLEGLVEKGNGVISCWLCWISNKVFYVNVFSEEI